MSLRIVKAGLLDTVQDEGRYGYQHLGINPNGCMDKVAMNIANALVGNSLNEAVIEMHFPAAEIKFDSDVMIAISGADFHGHINNIPININQPVIIKAGGVLSFKKQQTGARTYLALKAGLKIHDWLNSSSTNLKAAAGGYRGSALKKGDVLQIKETTDYSLLLNDKELHSLPWRIPVSKFYHGNRIRFLPGAEYDLLTDASKKSLAANSFVIALHSDRMGYTLDGTTMELVDKVELISSGVTKGTIQLLPNGQLIILMADHQTTGGYPRIGHVIGADFPLLAQMQALHQIQFLITDLPAAEEALCKQQLDLLQLQNACNFRLQQYFSTLNDH